MYKTCAENYDLKPLCGNPIDPTRSFPVGIWCQNDVVSMSMRRDHVASTLIRRHFHTKCTLGYGYCMTAIPHKKYLSNIQANHYK